MLGLCDRRSHESVRLTNRIIVKLAGEKKGAFECDRALRRTIASYKLKFLNLDLLNVVLKLSNLYNLSLLTAFTKNKNNIKIKLRSPLISNRPLILVWQALRTFNAIARTVNFWQNPVLASVVWDELHRHYPRVCPESTSVGEPSRLL
jgi:hypothetical protein